MKRKNFLELIPSEKDNVSRGGKPMIKPIMMTVDMKRDRMKSSIELDRF